MSWRVETDRVCNWVHGSKRVSRIWARRSVEREGTEDIEGRTIIVDEPVCEVLKEKSSRD